MGEVLPMKYLIAGGSAAGISALLSIRRRDPAGEITLVSAEPHRFYSRVLTSYYIAGKVPFERMFLVGDDFYEANGVRVMAPLRVEELFPDRHECLLSDGQLVQYDRFLAATGASARELGVVGGELPGVFRLRTIDDAVQIREWVHRKKHATVVGGGMVGLKAAEALHSLGMAVDVVVASNRVMSQVLDVESAAVVQTHLEDMGIRIHLRNDVTRVIGSGRVEAVELRSGEVLGADIVVVGRGVDPNAGFLKKAGAKGKRGVWVDDFMQTSLVDVYAAGDVCEAYDPVRGESAVNPLWNNAVDQGRIAGANMAGARIRSPGSISMNSFMFGNLSVMSLGRPEAQDGARVFARRDERGYRRIVLKDGHIVGAVAVGGNKGFGVLFPFVSKRVRFERPAVRLRATDSVVEGFLSGNIGHACLLRALVGRTR